MKFVIRLIGLCFFGVAAFVYSRTKGSHLEAVIQSGVVGLTLLLLPSLISTPQDKPDQEKEPESSATTSATSAQSSKSSKRQKGQHGKSGKDETSSEQKPKQKERPQSEKDEQKSKEKNRKRKERRKKAQKEDDDDEEDEDNENYMIQRFAQQDAYLAQIEAKRIATQAALKKAVEDAAKKEQRRKNKDDKKKPADQNWSTVGAKQAAKATKGGGNPNPKNAPLTGTGVGGRPIPGLKAPTAVAAAPSASADQGFSQASKVPDGASGHTKIQINVLNKHHGIIIGPKGETLKKLQASGAIITMPKKEAKSNVITLEGPVAAVRDCEAAIQSLISKGYSKYTHADQLTNEIAVPIESFGKIIGPKGVHLKAIQEKTKTKINIPGPGQGNKITLVGSKEGMKAAKDAIKSLLDHGFSSLTHEGFVSEEVPFPYEKRGFLIGPRGQSIKSIQGNTKAQITLPENKNFVVVAGTQAAIQAAKKAINKILNPPERPTRGDAYAEIDPKSYRW